MTDASNLTTVVNVPGCSQRTHNSQYNLADASNYTPDHGDYYRGKLPVMLPGAIIGVICLIAAFLLLVWVSDVIHELLFSGTFVKAAASLTVKGTLRKIRMLAVASTLL